MRNGNYQTLVGSYHLLLIVLTALIGLSSTPALAQSTVRGFYKGNAFGTYTYTAAGPLTGSQGQTALVWVPCSGTGGQIGSNTLNQLTVPGIITAEELTTTQVTNEYAFSKRVQTTATASAGRLLNGLITWDAIAAIATTQANASNITGVDTGSRFTNLRIAGLLNLPLTIPPNTRINLPGIGYVTLREVIRSGDGINHGLITVNMLHLVVTNSTNPLKLPVGLRIIVGHAVSGFVRNSLQVALGGSAFAATAKVDSAVIQNQIGRLAAIGLGCAGTGGQTATNTVNTINVAGILSLGTGQTTAFGQQTNTATTAQMTATLQNINLLSSRIQADAIVAVANSRFTSGQGLSHTTNSGFVNLRIQGVNGGQPLLNIAPNTKLTLPGIGTVILYERNLYQGPTLTYANVTMVRIIASAGNVLGLSAGAEIKLASATSQARPF